MGEPLISEKILIAGTDEAGRGPLAGPVVAAAVILTGKQRSELVAAGLNDSKKLTPAKREKLFKLMCDMQMEWKAQEADNRQIDSVNILQASLWCMKQSVLQLKHRPDIVLVDGNMLIPDFDIKQKCVIKGDSRVPAIAAASVVAKVLRDHIMLDLDKKYPQYGFARHMGYPTKFHKEMIEKYGPSPVHRMSFSGVKKVS